MKLAVDLNGMAANLRDALPKAAELAVPGVQGTFMGELSPEKLPNTARRQLRTLARGYNLEFAAVYCPLRRGLDASEYAEQRLDFLRESMLFAVDLGPGLLVMPLPKLGDPDEPRMALLANVLDALALHADRYGARIALEVGLDPMEAVLAYLNRPNWGSLGITFDPANFLLNGHDPVANLMLIGDRLLHVHARDAQRGSLNYGAEEMPLGAGNVPWLAVTVALISLEYKGFTVVRRAGEMAKPVELAQGIEFLRRLLPPVPIKSSGGR